MDAMRSFPSGHAQLSSFTAIFGIVSVGIRNGKAPSEKEQVPIVRNFTIQLSSSFLVRKITLKSIKVPKMRNISPTLLMIDLSL